MFCSALQGLQRSYASATPFFCDLLPVWADEVALKLADGRFFLFFEPGGLPLRGPMPWGVGFTEKRDGVSGAGSSTAKPANTAAASVASVAADSTGC